MRELLRRYRIMPMRVRLGDSRVYVLGAANDLLRHMHAAELDAEAVDVRPSADGKRVEFTIRWE